MSNLMGIDKASYLNILKFRLCNQREYRDLIFQAQTLSRELEDTLEKLDKFNWEFKVDYERGDEI